MSLSGNFFFRGGGPTAFFKATLMSLIEVQNVFPIINYDILDRLGHVWDNFDTVGSRKSSFYRQILPDFSARLADFGVFKAFISNFLYYKLYQGKLKVITRPQCALRFFHTTSRSSASSSSNFNTMTKLYELPAEDLEVVWKNEGHTAAA